VWLISLSQLFLTEDDARLTKQFLWVSSPGTATHWHFDQV
jgi:hypothetical protein